MQFFQKSCFRKKSLIFLSIFFFLGRGAFAQEGWKNPKKWHDNQFIQIAVRKAQQWFSSKRLPVDNALSQAVVEKEGLVVLGLLNYEFFKKEFFYLPYEGALFQWRGKTALEIAAKNGDLLLVRLLVEVGEMSNEELQRPGKKALNLAAQEGHWEVLEYFFQAIFPSPSKTMLSSLIRLATHANQWNTVRELLKKGAEPTWLEITAFLTQDRAELFQSVSLETLMLWSKKGPLLETAAKAQSIDCLRFFLEKGFDFSKLKKKKTFETLPLRTQIFLKDLFPSLKDRILKTVQKWVFWKPFFYQLGSLNHKSQEKAEKAFRRLNFIQKSEVAQFLMHSFFEDKSQEQVKQIARALLVVNQIVRLKPSPVFLAIENKDFFRLQYLLKTGFSPKVKRGEVISKTNFFSFEKEREASSEFTPFLESVYAGKQFLEILLKFGSDIREKTRTQKWTALYLAVKNGKIDIVEFLLKNGAFLEVSDRNGKTPLMLAVQMQQVAIVRALLNALKTWNQKELVKILNAKDKKRRTVFDFSKALSDHGLFKKATFQIREFLKAYEIYHKKKNSKESTKGKKLPSNPHQTREMGQKNSFEIQSLGYEQVQFSKDATQSRLYLNLKKPLSERESVRVYLGYLEYHHSGYFDPVVVKVYTSMDFENRAHAVMKNQRGKSSFVVRSLEEGVLLEDGKKRPYVVLEKIEGLNFAEILLIQKKLSFEEVMYFTHELLEALISLHQKGEMHLDLKPSNVLLDPFQKRVFLTDFESTLSQTEKQALSNSLTVLSRSLKKEIQGTPMYLDPLVLEGKVSVQADLYALAMVCYEALTGKVKNPYDRWPSEKNEAFPAWIDLFLQKALGPPSGRYLNAQEMKEVLEQRALLSIEKGRELFWKRVKESEDKKQKEGVPKKKISSSFSCESAILEIE